MSTTFPTSIDSYTHPSPNDPRSGSTSLSTFHSNLQDAITALETKVGTNSSAVTTSHDYKLSGVTGSDKAVSKTGTETLTNKTLTSPKINVGSDATGDMYYRASDGTLARLPAPVDGQIISYLGGVPTTIPNPAAADASTTVKGVSEIATTAEITAGTSTGGTGAKLVIPADAVGSPAAYKLVQYDSTGKLPAVDGSQLTGTTTVFTDHYSRAGATGAGTQTIAHGMGKTPKLVKISFYGKPTGTAAGQGLRFGTGTATSTSTNKCTGYIGIGPTLSILTPFNDSSNIINTLDTNSAGYTATITTLDSTNIILTWATPTSAQDISFEVEAIA